MDIFNSIWNQLLAIFELGGPVVMILIAVSVLTLSVILYKVRLRPRLVSPSWIAASGFSIPLRSFRRFWGALERFLE